jgi:CubicO group peptidase (beta-lactamase class C family)
MKLNRRRAAAFGSLWTLQACTSVSLDSDFKPALDRDLAALVADPRHPLLNVSALAIRDGRVVYQNQFGRRIVDSNDPSRDRPIGPDTLFRIASVSKLGVAVAVMRLVEDGKLSLDADVSDTLGWPLRNPAFPERPITLRHLLSHRSSLTDGSPAMYWWDVGVSLQDVLSPGGRLYRPAAYWRGDRGPGDWFNYVNLNYGVIGTVMERASGERFDRLVQRLVLTPLGLRGGFNPADFPAADVARIAPLYRKRRDEGERETWEPEGPWRVHADDFTRSAPQPPANLDRYVIGSNGTVFGPQGRLRISVADLGVLMRMLLNEGRHGGRAFLQPASVQALSAEQWRMDRLRPNGEAHQDWALSWGLGVQRFIDHSATDQRGPARGDRLVEGGGFTGWGHLGDAYGLKAAFALDPGQGQGLVVVTSGPGVDPASHAGRWSAMDRWQEQAITAVFRRALQGHID